MGIQQQQQTLAVIRLNFTTNEEKIARVGSKLYRREYKDGSIGLVGELKEGVNLKAQFTEGIQDVTDVLKGMSSISVRVKPEDMVSIDDYVTEENKAGLEITVDLAGDLVRTGMLTIKGKQTMSFTIYAESILEVEEAQIARVGNTYDRAFFDEQVKILRKEQEQAREDAIARNRQTQAAEAGDQIVAGEPQIEIRS